MYQQIDGDREKIEKAQKLFMKRFPSGLVLGFRSQQLKSWFHHVLHMCLRASYLAPVSFFVK